MGSAAMRSGAVIVAIPTDSAAQAGTKELAAQPGIPLVELTRVKKDAIKKIPTSFRITRP